MADDEVYLVAKIDFKTFMALPPSSDKRPNRGGDRTYHEIEQLDRLEDFLGCRLERQ
jgi:hypothetical protein